MHGRKRKNGVLLTFTKHRKSFTDELENKYVSVFHKDPVSHTTDTNLIKLKEDRQKLKL